MSEEARWSVRAVEQRDRQCRGASRGPGAAGREEQRERRATENGGARHRKQTAAAKSPFGSATRLLAWAVELPNGPSEM
jgi:hypothetical protein